MKLQEKVDAVLAILEKKFPNADTELHYKSAYELLVCVILSAQCTDKRVNQISPALFLAYPRVQDMAKASAEEIFDYIKSISYPNSKSKYLSQTAQMIAFKHKGEVPLMMEELTQFPGVGRKTANVMLAVLNHEARMPVDTHIKKMALRLGIVKEDESSLLAIENKLLKHIPEAQVHKAHHWLILHGRYTCLARKPKCQECEITAYCRYYKQHIKS